MNQYGCDWLKMANAVADALRDQTPNARAELLEAIDRSGMDVDGEGDGWLVVSTEGNRFLRVHESRVLRAPDDPGAN